MPQVKILGMHLVYWKFFILPTITLGVECAFDLFCRHDELLPWVLDRLQLRSLVIYKAWEGSCCFHQDLSTCSDMYNGKKLIFIRSLKPSFQRIKNHQFWRPVQGDMAESLSDVQSEINFGQIASPEYNRHNSLVRNPFHTYDGSLEI
jgi:hypothetical protein